MIPKDPQSLDRPDVFPNFGERFVVEVCPDGDGVLVDLTTGSYFRLNATAVLICRALESGRAIGEAIQRVAKALNLSAGEAEGLVSEVVRGLSNGVPPQGSPDPLRYVAEPGGASLFVEDDRTIFSVDRARRLVKLHASLEQLKAPLYFYVRSLMPKLLALLDVPVLHAAACRVPDSLLAFSGKSGAGKTTTARAFVGAGAELISEDILALSLTGPVTEIFLGGERFARGWAEEAAKELQRSPSREVSYLELRGTPQGPTAPITALWLIDAARRDGADIRLRPLSICDAISAMLGSGFLASVDPKHWRGFVRRSREIADLTAISEAVMPSTLDTLGAAVRRYIVNSAS